MFPSCTLQQSPSWHSPGPCGRAVAMEITPSVGAIKDFEPKKVQLQNHDHLIWGWCSYQPTHSVAHQAHTVKPNQNTGHVRCWELNSDLAARKEFRISGIYKHLFKHFKLHGLDGGSPSSPSVVSLRSSSSLLCSIRYQPATRQPWFVESDWMCASWTWTSEPALTYRGVTFYRAVSGSDLTFLSSVVLDPCVELKSGEMIGTPACLTSIKSSFRTKCSPSIPALRTMCCPPVRFVGSLSQTQQITIIKCLLSSCINP